MLNSLRHRGRTAGGDSRQGAESPLMRRASGALAWGVLNAAASRLGTLAIGIALARLLGPEEFGTYAVALLGLMAALSFNELGVSLAIVRWKDDPGAIAPTVATVSVASSALIAGTGVVAAPTLAAALGEPSAAPVLRILFLTVVVSGLVATPAALLQREFRQRTRTAIDQITIWVGALASVVLVIAGMGAMSLALGRLLGVAVSCVLFARAAPAGFKLGWRSDQVRPLLAFGAPLAGASIVVFLVGYIDQVIAARALGSTALALYVMAVNLSNWPVSVFSAPLRSVAPATFARLQHDAPAMRSTLTGIAGLLAAVVLPICLVLAGAAEPLVRLVYGAAWATAAKPLLWLAALAGLRILFELAYDFVIVAGGSRSLMFVQVCWLAALLPALLVGSRWGIAGLAAAQAAVAVAVVGPLYALVLRRSGVQITSLMRKLGVPATAASAAGCIASFLSNGVSSHLIAAGASLAVGGTAVIALIWRDLGTVRALRSMTPGASQAAPTGQPAS